MTLLDRYRLGLRAAGVIGMTLGGAGLVVLRETPFVGAGFLWAGICAWRLLRRGVWSRLIRVHYRRLNQAFAAEDAAETRRLVDELRAFETGGAPPWPGFRNTVAAALMLEERWQEAHDVLTLAERSGEVTTAYRADAMNNLAWTLVQLGRGAEAIATAEAALPLASARLRPYVIGTLGAANQVAGQPAKAVPLLVEALAGPCLRPAAQAARAYYLGEALHALGRMDEAIAAYRRAIVEASYSRYAQRAAQRLAAFERAAPYRC